MGSSNRQLIQRDHQNTVRFPALRRATKFHVACRTAESRTKKKRSVGMDGFYMDGNCPGVNGIL